MSSPPGVIQPSTATTPDPPTFGTGRIALIAAALRLRVSFEVEVEMPRVLGDGDAVAGTGLRKDAFY
jgi:hypothetical protein